MHLQSELIDFCLKLNDYMNFWTNLALSVATSNILLTQIHPKTNQVIRALEGDVSLEDLNEGIRPGHSRFYGSYGSSDYDSSQYNEDMKKFRKMALATQEYTGGDHSAATSEYGQNPSSSSTEGRQTHEIEIGKKKDSYGFGSS